MIPLLEAGFWDESRLRKLIEELDNRPDAILPRARELTSYVAFLCTKMDRAEPARRILYATLAWELAHRAAPADIAVSIDNVAQVEKLLGRERSLQDIRRAALDRSYKNDPAASG